MDYLKPFWRYYGAKWRIAPKYPQPTHDTIIEPFAGAAGYSLRHYRKRVVLIEKYPIVADIWQYLITADPNEILRIPTGVEHVDDLPAWCPTPMRHLIGWWFNNATTAPRKQLSAGRKKLALAGGKLEGWTTATRDRVASQVSHIRHWTVFEGSYIDAPRIRGTWFVDPPYNNKAGSYYVKSCNDIDYAALGHWCQSLPGQVIACENAGATWLPFEPLLTMTNNATGKTSTEVIWAK